MPKSIKLSVQNWHKLRHRLKEDYKWKPSILMIRSVMREQLGFTPRLHHYWNEQSEEYCEDMYLDFYNDHDETLFRLKYSEYLHD